MHFSPRAKQSRLEYPRRQQESFILCKLAQNQTTGDIQVLGDIFEDNPMPVLTAYWSGVRHFLWPVLGTRLC